MDHGRIQQVGPPREIYEHPVNQFVMSFVGPVNRLRRHLRAAARHRAARRAERHHLARRPSSAWCTSASRCGSSSPRDDGERLSAQVTRERADSLGLDEGGSIFVRPTNERIFTADGAGI